MTKSARSLSPEDILLLRAALLDGDVALSAFAAWRARVNWASITPAVTRMLPLLHHNLSRLAVTDPLMERLRGVRRFIWVGNLKRMTLTRRGFEALHSAGVPTIVFKGVALIICFLHDRSLRAMDDIDLLVPYDRLPDAVSALERIGIRPLHANAGYLNEHIRRRSTLHGWPFAGRETEDIDVHWHALHYDRQRNADDEFWAASKEVSFEGIPVGVFDSADQLLQICCHAAQVGSNTSLRWVADATHVVRGAASGLSWDRIVQQAARHRVSTVMADALLLLNRVVELVTPEKIIEQLERQASIGERIEARLAVRAEKSQLGWVGRQLVDFQTFRRGPNGFNTVSPLRAASAYFKEKYEVGAPARAAAAAIYETTGRHRSLRPWLGLGQPTSVADWRRLPNLSEELTFVEYTPLEWAFLRGWSAPEKTGRWTVGKEARIGWRLDGKSDHLACRIEAMPMLHDKFHPVLDVEIWANDVLVDKWHFDASASLDKIRLIAIPGVALMRHTILVLSFLVRNPFVPAEAGISADRRELGLHVRSLRIYGHAGSAKHRVSI